jgi:hypothetical protein
MQGRSWMAALTIVAGTLLLASPSARADDPPAPPRKVKLDLAIDGLGAGGCDLEIKPGHAGCQFKTENPHHITEGGKATIELTDVQTTSANRDCVFAITIREPGQEVRTVHRGLRLSRATPGRPAPVQTLTCYLSSPSKLARVNESRTRK